MYKNYAWVYSVTVNLLETVNLNVPQQEFTATPRGNI